MTVPNFIPLRAHTEFSITDSTIRIPDLAKRAAELGYPALAVSDLMNLFGALKFYQACRKQGIKPILGADVRIANPDRADAPFRSLLLVQNKQGYRRLCELLTRAYTDPQRNHHHPELRPEWLDESSNSGLICLCGAAAGEIGTHLAANHPERARAAAERYAARFPDAFYLELQRLPEHPAWETIVSASLKLADELDLPVVATHPTQFLHEDDFKAHDARVCIAEGRVLVDRKRPQPFVRSQYFPTPEQMAERFADLPEALENSLEIAKRCNFTFTLGENFLPDFPTPDGQSLNDYLRELSHQGLLARLAHLFPNEAERADKLPEYQQRLEFELNTIVQMGFAGYFLIVQDFINWAKNNGCPVGPGRGSGAGSLVAYALGITDLDPIAYALLFERFLNPERVSMPDFDIDFCQNNRGRVIEYVRQKYGTEAVSQIVTFGTMSSKAVIRDVGRVLELPFGLCDRLSKLIPLEANRPLPLQAALEAEPEILRLIEAEEAEELLNLALKLEDLTRNLGMHAGGVLIAPGKIADFCPVYQADESSSPVSMYDKGDVEDVGLVKFDFLGLRNLTIIETAQNFIRQTTGKDIDIAAIDLTDQTAYQIFRDANTTAVFQFESPGMKKMLLQAQNTSRLEEIIAFVSLYRPGPMDLIPDFIARMKGAKFEYMHPLLEPVLEPTYGIMVYQEQVMQAAQVIGGYSLGGADLLRRAMGKKKPEEMAKHRDIFAEGAEKQGISREKADEIFDYMEKFAGYGFNKSHAAAYAYVSYQTAWLKAHYPAEFMAATMSSELDNTDQLKVFYDDARSRMNGISFLPPDINESEYRFIPLKNKQIRYALGAIKGTGEAAVQSIVAAREKGGKFKNLFDFCERVGKQHVNRRTVEALIRGGAFDRIEPNRAMLLGNVEAAMQHAEQKANNANQGGLFDMFEDAIEAIKMTEIPAWDESTRLAEEKQVLGFYMSGHPFAPYEKEVRRLASTPLAKLRPHSEVLRVAGFATQVRHINGKNGKKVLIQLEDVSGGREVTVRGELLNTLSRDTLKADQILVCECRVREDTYNGEGGLSIYAHAVYTLDEARAAYARSLTLRLNPRSPVDKVAELLRPYVDPENGTVRLRLCYANAQASGELLPDPEQWYLSPDIELPKRLAELLGAENVEW
ncbi:DNA polymerase III subunit alpha [Conchiformibius steedae DSM 2580]|uniref:DNA polymerase III subunit alpha n=1 Tax=Conchiformibius steedae DSM 2580 TaxID=1121352 RepID=A0AAE9HXH4_9NEIS|nr:DNA polymerase III subunit alpha [Conchiformibius steedae]QMT34113.1 DNA polymerase III subunit alpha [Conchiformibius steedae]URD66886.1 DNA polymerase III subunit alpha [Conchiformibius steedae DSM 2580]